MTVKIPQNTQKYLTLMLESKIQDNQGEKLFENIEEYKKKYLIELDIPGTEKSNWASKDPYGEMKEKIRKKKEEKERVQTGIRQTTSGGFGSGGSEPSAKPEKYYGKDYERSVGEITMGDSSFEDIMGAAGLYGLGLLGAGLRNLKGSNTLLGQLGGQIEDLTGKSWFDTQVANIAKNQMGLVAQGAGSPWVPFYLPGKSKSKPKAERERDDVDDAIRDRERRDKAQKYGIPYP